MALTRSDLATPLAVLVGAGLIAGVLWQGLGRVAQVLNTQPAPGVRVASAVAEQLVPHLPAVPPLASATPSAASPEGGEARRNRIAEQVELALARQRSDYVRACWKPQAPAPGEPPDFGGAFEMQVQLAASGVETGRVVLSGGYARPALLACVRATKLAPLRIPAPGEAITVTVHMPVP